MNIDDHYALSTGQAPLPDGRLVQLTVIDLGELNLASGMLAACDPFVTLDSPVVVPIAPGRFPVRVTVADVSDKQDGSHRREAYLSVVLSDAQPASVEPALTANGAPEPDSFYGVGVDAGTVAFVDAQAASRFMPGADSDWYSEVFDTGRPDSWFAQMDSATPQPRGCANITLPLAVAGENLVLAHSGWGDGFYPLLQTKGPDGAVLAVHIDLQVVGPIDDEDDDDEEGVAAAPGSEGTQEPAPRGWLGRLLKRG